MQILLVVGAATAIGFVGYKASEYYFDQSNDFTPPSRLQNTDDDSYGVKDTIGTVSDGTKNVPLGVTDTLLNVAQDSTNKLQEHAGNVVNAATNNAIVNKPLEIGSNVVSKLPSFSFRKRTALAMIEKRGEDRQDGGSNFDKSFENVDTSSTSGYSKLVTSIF